MAAPRPGRCGDKNTCDRGLNRVVRDAQSSAHVPERDHPPREGVKLALVLPVGQHDQQKRRHVSRTRTRQSGQCRPIRVRKMAGRERNRRSQNHDRPGDCHQSTPRHLPVADADCQERRFRRQWWCVVGKGSALAGKKTPQHDRGVDGTQGDHRWRMLRREHP